MVSAAVGYFRFWECSFTRSPVNPAGWLINFRHYPKRWSRQPSEIFIRGHCLLHALELVARKQARAYFHARS